MDPFSSEVKAGKGLGGKNSINTPGADLVEYINALPFERYLMCFLQTDIDIIIIHILSQYQDASLYLNRQ
ncbi:type II toxin-antitoxin system RelE/ParE family toxin [Salmonella enterica subsp. salamae]|nr:type II toxin-antitoxin system RelE/ParE family toxin [Salmonella enterica subsp. salamae]EDW5992783.1 type II toxin-antitoxin system RelE/ParE family toxin [Salmonella enterica subsp. salamae]